MSICAAVALHCTVATAKERGNLGRAAATTAASPLKLVHHRLEWPCTYDAHRKDILRVDLIVLGAVNVL